LFNKFIHMNDRDQELFRILRISVTFYGLFLLIIWIYFQLTNSWGTGWLNSIMVLLIILLIFSGSTKFILENKTLLRIFSTVQKYLEEHPRLSNAFRAIMAYFKLKRKFRKIYLPVIFISLLIMILWIIVIQYIIN